MASIPGVGSAGRLRPSVCAGQRLCGAPRRNRTGDPILTIDVPVVHNAVQDLPLHVSAQVKGPAEGWVEGQYEAACSAVTGKSLARTLHGRPMAQALAPSSGSLDRTQTHPWRSAVLRRLRVERRANDQASSVMPSGVDGRVMRADGWTCIIQELEVVQEP